MFWFGIYIKSENANKKPNFLQADLFPVGLQLLGSCSSVAVIVWVTCVGFLWGETPTNQEGFLWRAVGKDEGERSPRFALETERDPWAASHAQAGPVWLQVL